MKGKLRLIGREEKFRLSSSVLQIAWQGSGRDGSMVYSLMTQEIALYPNNYDFELLSLVV